VSEIGLRKSDLDTPALWVDLNLLECNIASLAEHFLAAGVHWRPHTKGMKVPALAHKVIAAGAIGITCAKLGEAEVMAAAGITDILIANQIVGPRKIARLVNLRRHTNVKVAADNEANVAELGAAASAKGVELGVVIELDVGMERAGVAPGKPALELARTIAATPGLRFLGLMAWEGHAAGIKDPAEKRQAIEKAIDQLTTTADRCRAAGLPVEIVSCGGSMTYLVTPFLSGITEIQAGGAIFNDMAYTGAGVKTDQALFMRVTVTSRPTPNRIIIDAGYKTLPAWHAMPKPVGLSGFKTLKTSAEHGYVILEEPNSTVKVGDTLDFIVGYGDATVYLHDRMYGIRDGIVETVWEVQGRGKLQ
jgi:D-serine deaminase-like pyridoxal phosphate-dependent protein